MVTTPLLSALAARNSALVSAASRAPRVPAQAIPAATATMSAIPSHSLTSEPLAMGRIGTAVTDTVRVRV